MVNLAKMMAKAKEPKLTPAPIPAKVTKAKTIAELVALSRAKGMVATGIVEDQIDVINKARARKESNLESIEVAKPTVLTKLTEPEPVGISWEQLDDSQQSAINLCLPEQFCCITGAAGTGKTTITKILINKLVAQLGTVDLNNYSRQDRESDERKDKKLAPSIAFCAFTGRATEQVRKNLPTKYHPAIMTIHSLLGFYPEFFEDEIESGMPGIVEVVSKRRFIPWYDEHNKLPWKVIVIDEAGMVPIPLWEQLWAACDDDVRIIMIGDINQLPPVQGRSVFGFALNEWPSAELTHIHRQKGENNPIVDNAWRVLQGKYPQNGPGFMMIDVDKIEIKDVLGKVAQLEGSQQAAEVLKMYVMAMNQQGHFNDETDTIIVPQNGDKPGAMGYNLGQIPLNSHFCIKFNPPPAKNATEQITGRRVIIESGYETKHFAIADKVMVTANDRPRGLTNGMIGKIVDIAVNGNSEAAIAKATEFSMEDLSKLMIAAHEAGHDEEESSEEYNKRAASHIITVNFGKTLEGQEVIETFSTVGQINSLILAYAITCHKSQGGEYPTVVIMCHSSNHRLLYREWLYTAITRAQFKVILFFNNKGLSQALRRQKIKGKTLEEKAQAFLDWSGVGEGPDLPMAGDNESC